MWRCTKNYARAKVAAVPLYLDEDPGPSAVSWSPKQNKLPLWGFGVLIDLFEIANKTFSVCSIADMSYVYQFSLTIVDPESAFCGLSYLVKRNIYITFFHMLHVWLMIPEWVTQFSNIKANEIFRYRLPTLILQHWAVLLGVKEVGGGTHSSDALYHDILNGWHIVQRTLIYIIQDRGGKGLTLVCHLAMSAHTRVCHGPPGRNPFPFQL